jgi:hypothetical protein
MELESLAKQALQRLEKVCFEVEKQQGFTPETEKLRLLIELLKEQIHEDSDRRSS